MKVVAWIRDWTIITIGPWASLYLFWHGPLVVAVAVATLTVFALASRLSRQ